MMDLNMVGMWLWHIPFLHHYDILPPGGNMLESHDDDSDGDVDDDAYGDARNNDDDNDRIFRQWGSGLL